MGEKITRMTMIGELIMEHPVAAHVLMEHGFHCIGCGLSAYETLEQGALAHGFDESEVDVLVGKINDAVENEKRLLESEGLGKLPSDIGGMAPVAASKSALPPASKKNAILPAKKKETSPGKKKQDNARE